MTSVGLFGILLLFTAAPVAAPFLPIVLAVGIL